MQISQILGPDSCVARYSHREFGARLLGTLRSQEAHQSLAVRIARGAVWSIVGSGLSQSLGLIATVICARLLGRSSYGELGIILATVYLFATVASVGLGVTATAHVAQFKTTDPCKAGRTIGMSLMVSYCVGMIVALALVCAAPWLSKSVLNAPNLGTELRIGSLMMFFAAVNAYQNGVLSGFEAFRTIAMLNLIRGVVSCPLIVAGVTIAGLRGALLAYTVVSAFTFGLYQVAIRKQCKSHGVPISYRCERADARVLWSFSLPVLIATLSFTPATWWSNALLVGRTSFAEMGLFSAALQLQAAVMFLSNAVGNIGLPTLSSIVGEKNMPKYTRVLAINFALTALPALLAAVPFVVASSYIMSLYGPQFKEGAAVLRLLSIATVLTSLNITVGHAIWSLEAPIAGMVLAIMRGVTLIACTYLFVSRGAVGLATAYVVTGVVLTAIQAPFMFGLLRSRAKLWSGESTPSYAVCLAD